MLFISDYTPYVTKTYIAYPPVFDLYFSSYDPIAYKHKELNIIGINEIKNIKINK